MSTEIEEGTEHLKSYADLPLSAFEALRDQADLGGKSLQRTTNLIRQYLELNKAYSESLKRLASSTMIEKDEQNPIVKKSLAYFRGFLLNESRQSEEFVKALNLEAVEPLKHTKEKNEKQNQSAVVEIQKIIKSLGKKKRETAIASTQAAKAAARVQKETRLAPTSKNDESAVKMSFDDFFASESDGSGPQSSGVEIAATATVQEKTRKAPKYNKETTGGGTEMDAISSKLSAWLTNSANKINNHLN